MMKPSQPKRRLTKEKRKKQLLGFAIKIAASKGLGQLVHADIAEEADMVAASVFRYFPSRKELIRNVVDEVGQFYRNQSDLFHDDPNDPVHAIRDHLEAFSKTIDTHRDYAAVWLQWGASVQNDCGIWDMFQEHNDYLIRQVSRTLRKAQEKYDKNDIEVSRSRARSLLGLAFALTMLKFSNNPQESVDRFISIALQDILH